jgi:uncharacterized protein YggU (UPF0235/DUF167 family)
MISLVVKVKPGVFKDEIVFDTEGELTIKIRERPIDGAANDYLIRFLAKEWDMRRSDVLLEKGLSSRFKKILLNIEPEELEKILNKYRK